MYTNGKSFQELLDFVVKLPNFAPFNAMLLQVQKPGLTYAASTYDWQQLFGRYPKDDARPLLILWPFGPVALVYDVLDTEGRALPEDVRSFLARDKTGGQKIDIFRSRLESRGIGLRDFDGGDDKAGYIKRSNQGRERYRVSINRNHDDAVQFVTLAHELGHLYLGHLGADDKLKVPGRVIRKHKVQEIEAESVAYLVSNRNGVESRSEKYLSEFVDSDLTVDRLDVHQIMRATGQVEALLGLQTYSRFDAPPPASQQGRLFRGRQSGNEA